jgi:hypothetical protein
MWICLHLADRTPETNDPSGSAPAELAGLQSSSDTRPVLYSCLDTVYWQCRQIPWHSFLSLYSQLGRSQWSRGLNMNCLRSLQRWDRGFESHSRHGCLSAFILCLCCPVCRQAVALRRDDSPSKESYRLCKKDYETEEEARAQQRAAEPLMNE